MRIKKLVSPKEVLARYNNLVVDQRSFPVIVVMVCRLYLMVRTVFSFLVA